MAHGRPDDLDYSNLEVAAPVGQPQSVHDGHGSSAPEAVVWESSKTPQEPSASGFNTYHDYEGHDSQYPHSQYPQNEQHGYDYPPPIPETQPKRERCCGLSRKMMWIIAIGVIVIIAGLAGGLAGGLVSKKQSSNEVTTTPSQSNSTVPTTNSTVPTTTGPIVDSQLAAFNWTDSSSITRRAVFYQRDGALFLSQCSTKNPAWVAFNISAAFIKQNAESNALNVKPETPLSVVARPKEDEVGINANKFVATLYFIDIDNLLRELVSADEDLTTWIEGDLGKAGHIADKDSRLAAVGAYCPTCIDGACLMYQDTDFNVEIACFNNWASPVTLAQGYQGAGLAAIPFGSDEGQNITSVSEFRLFYYTNTVVDMYYFNYLGYEPEASPIIKSQLIVQDKVPQVVSTWADSHSSALALSMDGNSVFTGSFYSKTEWNYDQTMRFINEDGKSTDKTPSVQLTSIAMDQNGYFYGVAADGKSIVEYSWNSSAPFDLTWTGSIAIDN